MTSRFYKNLIYNSETLVAAMSSPKKNIFPGKVRVRNTDITYIIDENMIN